MVGVPETVECPCGTGYADRLPVSTTEPGARVGRRRVTYSYRHTGCHIGGQIVVEADRVIRRAGPLFHPTRFGVDTDTNASEEPVVALAADGGTVIDQ